MHIPHSILANNLAYDIMEHYFFLNMYLLLICVNVQSPLSVGLTGLYLVKPTGVLIVIIYIDIGLS